jgi:hypothetical protein
MKNYLLLLATLAVSGCAGMYSTNADLYADQAEALARGCSNPEVAAAAAATRASADGCAGSEQQYEQARSAADMLASHLADIQRELGDIDRLSATAAETCNGANARAEFLRQASEANHRVAEGCMYDSESCLSAVRVAQRREAELTIAADRLPTQAQCQAALDAAYVAEKRRTTLETQVRQLESQLATQESAATTYLQSARQREEEAAANLQATQRLAEQQCTLGSSLANAPREPGEISASYSQEILNSQSMGLRSLVGSSGPVCCSTIPICGACTGDCPPECSTCNAGC